MNGTPTNTEEAGRYYYRRAETELKMAQAAASPAAVNAHYQLANLYLDRVFGDTSNAGQALSGLRSDDAT